jgi:hypothetical protein
MPREKAAIDSRDTYCVALGILCALAVSVIARRSPSIWSLLLAGWIFALSVGLGEVGLRGKRPLLAFTAAVSWAVLGTELWFGLEVPGPIRGLSMVLGSAGLVGVWLKG